MTDFIKGPRLPAAWALGMGAGGLASSLTELSMIPKAIAVGLIAAAVFATIMAIARPNRTA